MKSLEATSQKKVDVTELQKLQKKVEDVIEKSLKERDNEEKEQLNRRRNIIVFKLPESKKPEPEDRKEEDIKKFIGLCKSIIKITFDQDMIESLLISLKDESKNGEIFQNLNKIRELEAPFNKISIAHDLTKNQKEELQDKIKEAHDRKQSDQSGEWMYHMQGPPWNWHVKKIPMRRY